MNYLLLRDGVQYGPYTWLQLQEMLDQGSAAGTDSVRPEDSEEWLTLAALAQRLEPAVPTPEPAGAPALATVHAYSRQGSEPADGPPTYRLFDYKAVTAATIFGTPFTGIALIAINYYRLRLPKSAVKSIVAGLVGMALAIGISSQLGRGASSGLAIGLIVITSNAARMYQEKHLVEHQRRGGQLASRWGAFFIGLGVGVVLSLALAAVVAVLMLILDGPGA